MEQFNNLVEMQEFSCRQHQNREMYGTRKNGVFEWITFDDFAVMVDEVRGGLASLGISYGDKVAVIADNCVEWPVCAYAVYGLGAYYVPMYENQSAEDWDFIIRDSGAKILLVRNKTVLEKTRHLPQQIKMLEKIVLLQDRSDDIPSLMELREHGRNHPVPSEKPDRNDPFGLIYTSGTTGSPKGVILTHGNLMVELESVTDLLDFHPTDRSLAFLPWGHLMGQIEEVHFLILKGFSTAIVEDVQNIMDDFTLIQPTIFFTVPKLFQRLYDAVNDKLLEKGGIARFLFEKGSAISARKRKGERIGLKDKIILVATRKIVFNKVRSAFGGKLRMAMSGGAALSVQAIGFMENLGVIVYEGYGMTETTMAVSANSRKGRRYGSVGRALLGVSIVLDKSVDGAGENEGEIIVYGPHIAAGYHNQRDLFNRSMTPDGGFRTGDVGRIDDDGFLYITGRVKELYKLDNGKYIAPALLEEELKQSHYISYAMLYGANRPFNVAVVTPETTAFKQDIKTDEIEKIIEAEITKHSQYFKTYEKPKKFIVINEEWTPGSGLLTPTLKIKRPAILKKYMPEIEKLYQKR